MDKKLLSLVSLFLLTFALFAGVVTFNKPLTSFTRAKETVTASPSNSLLFVWPLSAAADGSKTAAVTVFVRSTTDKPISGQSVTLKTTLGSVKTATESTDAEGKATFSVTSTDKGTAEVTAFIDNAPLSQKVSVKFE